MRAIGVFATDAQAKWLGNESDEWDRHPEKKRFEEQKKKLLYIPSSVPLVYDQVY